MSTALYVLTDQYRELLARLDDPDLDDQALVDTLEGLEGELTAKATNVARYVANCDAFAEAIAAVAKETAERGKRIQRKADRIREYLHGQLELAGITKIEAPEFTLAIRKNPPRVVIVDETALPKEYFSLPPPPPAPTPDKKRIADALKAGGEVAGAHLEQSTRLEIRA